MDDRHHVASVNHSFVNCPTHGPRIRNTRRTTTRPVIVVLLSRIYEWKVLSHTLWFVLWWRRHVCMWCLEGSQHVGAQQLSALSSAWAFNKAWLSSPWPLWWVSADSHPSTAGCYWVQDRYRLSAELVRSITSWCV